MKYKILHLNASTGLAGAERVLLNYLACHDKKLFSVQVASYVNYQRQNNSFTEVMEKQGIPFHKIFVGSSSFITVVFETVKLIRDEGIDLVHSHGYRSDVSGCLAARIAGIPIVSTVHGWTPISWKLRLYEQIDRWFLKRFAGIIAVSKDIYNSLVASGVSQDKIFLINNAVPQTSVVNELHVDDTTRLICKEPNERIILSVGRLSHEKGYDILLRSFQKYCLPEMLVKLVIVGEGPLRDELEALAADLGITERVIFTGFSNAVRQYYKESDLFVLPSRTEGLPMVVLEAMQLGMPVVCTNVGGLPEVIKDGKNGILVEPENIDALGDAIRKLLDNQSLSNDIGKAGMMTICESFSADIWAQNIEKFYMQLLENV